MADIADIFKANDIRGKVGTELTPAVAGAVGTALARWLPTSGPVAVGRDMRPDSAELAQALIEGLLSQGRDVWDIGQVTSDMIYFAVGHHKLAGGAMITASHNPGSYNGIKLSREAAMPIGAPSGLLDIRDAVISGPPAQSAAKRGSLIAKDIDADWIQHVLSFVDVARLKPLHIAVDAGNGMAGKIFPRLQPHVPFSVEPLYFELDGTFPNHIANPLEPKNLVDLQALVRSKGCQAGLAFDGDGDRAVLVDEQGEPLSGTVLSALLAEYFLGKHPGATILLNAICGRAAFEVVAEHGGNPVRTKVGHAFIKADMLQHNAIFAGEHSGHYYFKDNFLADSGLIAAIIGLHILSQSDKPLSELAAPLRNRYKAITETNFEAQNKQAIINAVAKAFPAAKQDHLDGLTVSFDDAWINVRPSNTEPLLRLNAEARTQKQLDSLVQQVTNIIQAQG